MLENVESLTMILSAACEQYRFVKMANAGQIARAAAVTEDVVGIALEGRTAAQITATDVAIAVAMPNCKCFIEAGAVINVAAAVVPLTSDATGRAIAVAAATDRVLGYACQSAAAVGEIIEIYFIKGASHRDA